MKYHKRGRRFSDCPITCLPKSLDKNHKTPTTDKIGSEAMAGIKREIKRLNKSAIGAAAMKGTCELEGCHNKCMTFEMIVSKT